MSPNRLCVDSIPLDGDHWRISSEEILMTRLMEKAFAVEAILKM
jgi:hypothetical protein